MPANALAGRRPSARPTEHPDLLEVRQRRGWYAPDIEPGSTVLLSLSCPGGSLNHDQAPQVLDFNFLLLLIDVIEQVENRLLAR